MTQHGVVNNFYNAWKEQRTTGILAIDPDTLRMRDAVLTYTRCVCREDVRREWNRVNSWWFALTGDELSIPPAAFIADRFECAYKNMTARMTSEVTRRQNQEYAEPNPVNPNYCQG